MNRKPSRAFSFDLSPVVRHPSRKLLPPAPSPVAAFDLDHGHGHDDKREAARLLVLQNACQGTQGRSI
jgi:hypothetical protein